MRFLFSFICVCLIPIYAYAQKNQQSPLARFSNEWNDKKYLVCNTAAQTKYLSDSEKIVIYILNLARLDPKLFCETVVKHYPDLNSDYDYEHSDYFHSLITTLNEMTPLNLLYPDSACTRSAYGHASSSGKTGYTGHVRQSKEAQKLKHFNGECCDYGHNRPLDIIMSLLIDQDIESLGHRRICLGEYHKIGLSMQPHLKYRYTATLDFYY